MNARQMLGALLVTGLMAATANAVDPYQRTGVIDSRDPTAGVIVVNDAEYRLPAYLPVAGGSQQDLLPGRHVGFDVADSDPNLIEALWLLADAPPPSTE